MSEDFDIREEDIEFYILRHDASYATSYVIRRHPSPVNARQPLPEASYFHL